MDIKEILGDENEKPLDRLCTDGGFTGIFRTIACIGDSLSSGEFQVKSTYNGTEQYIDRYDYSWGQYLARMAGCTVYNFSRGGMTAREYVFSYANLMGYWQRERAANAYIIALGVNELFNRKWAFGSFDDVNMNDYTKNVDTFVGNFAAIIQRYKEIQPEATFFLVTNPRTEREKDPEIARLSREHRDAMYKFAEIFSNTYVIDLYDYAPVYDEEFQEKFFLGGHMTPTGYILTAKMICSYIDYIVRHNMEKFKTVGLMGFDYDRSKIQ